MTREEAIKYFENGINTNLRLKKKDKSATEIANENIEAYSMAILALSIDGEYIKKSELFGKTVKRNSIWNEVTNSEGKGLEEIVNDLPTYSFPETAEPEKEYIDKTELVQKLNAWDCKAHGMPNYAWRVIDEMPTYSIFDSAENKGERKHGHWVRMSDLPEDKDDRYKCSRCGNVVHHSSGVNLYHFNSWCGACGSLNNSLLAGLEPIEEKGE